MSALTKKEEAIINIMATRYSLPVLYSTTTYGSTSRKIKSLKRTPQWTYDLARLIESPERIDDTTSIGFCVTGSWAALPLLTFGINEYTESIDSLLKLAISVQGNMRDSNEEELLSSYVDFLRDGLDGNLPVITAKEIADYQATPIPKGNPKFPKFSTTGGTDILEDERLFKLALGVTDNTQTLKYLNGDRLFEAAILDGLSQNPYSSEEVLVRVLDLLSRDKMDYTNFPEKDYYLVLSDISRKVERRLGSSV